MEILLVPKLEWNARSATDHFPALGRNGLLVSAFDCDVRGPVFESHHGRLCLSRQPLRFAVFSTSYAPLLQCLCQLGLASLWGLLNRVPGSAWVNA